MKYKINNNNKTSNYKFDNHEETMDFITDLLCAEDDISVVCTLDEVEYFNGIFNCDDFEEYGVNISSDVDEYLISKYTVEDFGGDGSFYIEPLRTKNGEVKGHYCEFLVIVDSVLRGKYDKEEYDNMLKKLDHEKLSIVEIEVEDMDMEDVGMEEIDENDIDAMLKEGLEYIDNNENIRKFLVDSVIGILDELEIKYCDDCIDDLVNRLGNCVIPVFVMGYAAGK